MKIDQIKISNFGSLRNIIIFFFSLIFVVGIICADDYGVSSDEYETRIQGFVNLDYIGQKISPEVTDKFKKNKNLPYLQDESYSLKTYGVLYDTFVSLFEVIFKIEDKRNQFIFKHYFNFLIFFLCLICFYKLCNIRFNDWKYSLFGVLLLILSPRIFANSFYNNKDIIFLCYLLFSVFFGIKFFKKINLKNALLFALSNSLAIAGVRFYGLISPIIIYPLLIFYTFITKETIKKKLILILTSFVLTIIFTIIFWPYLWENTLANFINIFKFLNNLDFGIYSLFYGKIIEAKNMPWYYSILWIVITTPLFYIILSLYGIFNFFIKLLLETKKNFNTQNFYLDSIFVLILTIPIVGSIIFKSSSYNGWRHLYFIYPYLIIFSLLGYKKIIEKISNSKIFTLVFNVSTISIILFYLFWMAYNHPHQYAYFNILAGKDIHKKFDIDYWGLSYKENLNYISQNDSREKIYIKNNSENNLFYFLFSLEHEKRKKFIYNFENRAPDYIITNYYLEKRYKKFDDNYLENYYIYRTIMVNGSPINTVFKKK